MFFLRVAAAIFVCLFGLFIGLGLLLRPVTGTISLFAIDSADRGLLLPLIPGVIVIFITGFTLCLAIFPIKKHKKKKKAKKKSDQENGKKRSIDIEALTIAMSLIGLLVAILYRIFFK